MVVVSFCVRAQLKSRNKKREKWGGGLFIVSSLVDLVGWSGGCVIVREWDWIAALCWLHDAAFHARRSSFLLLEANCELA